MTNWNPQTLEISLSIWIISAEIRNMQCDLKIKKPLNLYRAGSSENKFLMLSVIQNLCFYFKGFNHIFSLYCLKCSLSVDLLSYLRFCIFNYNCLGDLAVKVLIMIKIMTQAVFPHLLLSSNVET